MSPSDLSKELRRIASTINNSKNPSKELALKDIRRVVAAIADSGDSEEYDDSYRINILNQPVTIDVPGFGSAEVTITRCDHAGEKSVENMFGTIKMRGLNINLECYVMDRIKTNQSVEPRDAIPLFKDIEDATGWRAVDLLGVAAEQVVLKHGYQVVDITTIEDGHMIEGLEKL